MRAAVVYQDEWLLYAIRSMLRPIGCECIDVALDSLPRGMPVRPIDLVILEVPTDERDAHRAVEAVKRCFNALPITAIMQRNAAPQLPCLVIALGVRCAMSRPFSQQQLLQVVREVTPMSRNEGTSIRKYA